MNDLTSEFLWNAAMKCGEVVTSPLDAEILKIHLRSNCVERQLEANADLPKSVFGVSSMCKGCRAPWTSGQFSLHLSSKKPPKRRTLKLADKDPSLLTKWQRKLRLLSMKPEKNILEMTCSVCKTVNKVPLVKPPRMKVEQMDETPGGAGPVKKLKKKKKRDSFAGLNASAVKTFRESLTSTPLSTMSAGRKRKREPAEMSPQEDGHALPDASGVVGDGNISGSVPEDEAEGRRKKNRKKKKRKSLVEMQSHNSSITNTTPPPFTKLKTNRKKARKSVNEITPKRNSLMADFLNSL